MPTIPADDINSLSTLQEKVQAEARNGYNNTAHSRFI
jgi:hypothetical protein